MPQVPVLLKKRGLSGDSDGFSFDDYFDYSVPDVSIVDPDIYVYTPTPDPVSGDVIYVNDQGNTIDAEGNVLIRADEVVDAVTMAEASPEAIARVLAQTSPNWAAQFRNADDLIRAAAGLVSTVKAAVSGKPIPPSPNSPGVIVRPVSTQKPAQSGGLTAITGSFAKIPPAALIGGAALVAYLILRSKKNG